MPAGWKKRPFLITRRMAPLSRPRAPKAWRKPPVGLNSCTRLLLVSTTNTLSPAIAMPAGSSYWRLAPPPSTPVPNSPGPLPGRPKVRTWR